MKKFFTALFLVQSMLWICTHSLSAQNSIAINSDADRAPSDKNTSTNIIPQGIESMWDILFNYDLLVATSAQGNAGVCFFNNEFWVSRWGYMGDDTILRIDASGNLIDKFRITGVTGTRSFTTDGTYIYAGINTNSIKKIDPATKTLVSSITAPIANVRSLTYDATANSGAGGFWISTWTTDITLISMTGATLSTIPASSHGLTAMYGTAVDNVSAGGPFLWVFDQGSSAGASDIVQISIATQSPTGVIHDVMSDVGLAQGSTTGLGGGIFFYNSTLIGVLQGTPANLLFAYDIADWGPITTAFTSDNCPSDSSGTATVSVSGGNPPYTYLWSFGPANGQTTQTATGLSAGNYIVSITDTTGATTTASVTVYSNLVVSISSASVTCNGGNNGSATATLGGTAPYTYMWGNGQTAQTATGLTAGTYTLTASNADGCINTATVNISSPAAIAITTTTVPVSCFNGCNGSAVASVSGGVSSYTYGWSNGMTTQSITGLCAGSYILIVSDANGCTKTATVTLANPTAVAAAITSNIATTCSTCNDGKATASGSGGTGPYTYSWSTSPVQTTATATGLSVNTTYTVCVTDSKGCSTCTTVTIADGTGVHENPNPGDFISIYPNPVKERVNIHLDKQNNADIHLQIMDVQGKIVFDKNTRGLNNYINLSHIHSGLYLVKASYDGKIFTSKLVKE